MPGPGTYAALGISKMGIYPISNFQSSRAAVWSPAERFSDFSQRKSTKLPGPGTFNPSDVDSMHGGYLLSNFRNTGNVKFTRPKEQFVDRSVSVASRVATPGPGTYLLPSEFGHTIDSKVHYRAGTQGSGRPRLVSRLQLSTLTGPPISGISNFDRNFESTDRDNKFINKSLMVKNAPNHFHNTNNST